MKQFFLFVILFLTFSCETKTAGICLSFDDKTVKEWYSLKQYFKDNNVKVTFFITGSENLSIEEILYLKDLENDGHEIGFHGTMHVVSEYYIKEKTYKEYFNNEIFKGLRDMKLKGFNPKSFAYPYGSKYWFTDLILLQFFDFTRNVTPRFGQNDLTKLNIYHEIGQVDKRTSALGIDRNSNVTIQMLDCAMKKAVNDNLVLMLYAHKPVSSDTVLNYEISKEYLYKVVELSKKNNLKFLTFEELL